MLKNLPIMLTVTALLGLTSCRAEPKPGHLRVEYGFQGVESPSRVSVYLLDTETAFDCDTITGNPFTLAVDSRRSLPISDVAEFKDLPYDSEWVVVAVGANEGAEVARGCVDGLKIEDGETTYAEMDLVNVPYDIQGAYTSTMEFNLGLPVEAIGAVLTYDAVFADLTEFVCDVIVECDEETTAEEQQAIATRVLVMLSSLDVEVEWHFRQSADLVTGEMVWNTVEGVVVDPTEWEIVQGTFAGEIPGTTRVVFTSYDLRIQGEDLVFFLLDEVMGYTLVDGEVAVDSVMPDIKLSSGGAVAVDDDFTGQADRVSGEMHASLDFISIGFVHSFDVVWVAERSTGGGGGGGGDGGGAE